MNESLVPDRLRWFWTSQATRYAGRRQADVRLVKLRWPGFFRERPGGADVDSVKDVPCGGWAWLQVRVWDVGLGATYEEATARNVGGYGESNVFYAQGGCPPAQPPTLPGVLRGLQLFSVREIIPEPSVAALFMLGLSGLALDRQRRP